MAQCAKCALFPWKPGSDLNHLPAARCHEKLPMKRFAVSVANQEHECPYFTASGEAAVKKDQAPNANDQTGSKDTGSGSGSDVSPEAAQIAALSVDKLMVAIADIEDVQMLQQILAAEEAKGEKARKTAREALQERIQELTNPNDQTDQAGVGSGSADDGNPVSGSEGDQTDGQGGSDDDQNQPGADTGSDQ